MQDPFLQFNVTNARFSGAEKLQKDGSLACSPPPEPTTSPAWAIAFFYHQKMIDCIAAKSGSL
jgi:hypothetical protein